jgi:hypothetical protein
MLVDGLHVVYRLLVEGQACDCDTFLMVRGLYEGQELSSDKTCSQVGL